MAMLPEDVGSWLPSEFLTVEDSFVDKENFNRNGSNSEFKPSLNFPTEFPYEFDPFGSSSAHSSPVESVVGSAESGDDDNGDSDFLSGLTRRLTQQLAVKPENSKWVMAGSPKSTLSGIGNWSVSSNGSPTAGISPPTTPFELKTDPCDLFYEAAGQVARLKMSSEGQICQERHVLSRINQYRNQDQVPRPQFWVREQVKGGFQDQQLHLQEQIQNRARLVGYENGKGVRSFLLPQSAWPPPQVQLNHTNSGARQLIINGPGGGVKREKSTGTGVFLPRRYGNPPDRKKKQGCSTVLLPAKVVQALNLDYAHFHPRHTNGFASEYDALLNARTEGLLAQQRRGLRAEAVLRLPQEWTY